MEVIAAIAGIVGAFAASKSLYYQWRDKQEARKEKKRNKRMETSLIAGRTEVQTGYNVGFQRLGKQFAVGDDRSRIELLPYLLEIIKFQQSLMSLLATDSGVHAIPQFEALLLSSEGTRKGVVGVLSEQYQRMEQSRPINRALTNASQDTPALLSGVVPPITTLIPMPRNRRLGPQKRGRILPIAEEDLETSQEPTSSSSTRPQQSEPTRNVSTKDAPARSSAALKLLVDQTCSRSGAVVKLKESKCDLEASCPCGAVSTWPTSYYNKDLFVFAFGKVFEADLWMFHLVNKLMIYYCPFCMNAGKGALFLIRPKLVAHCLALHRHEKATIKGFFQLD